MRDPAIEAFLDAEGTAVVVLMLGNVSIIEYREDELVPAVKLAPAQLRRFVAALAKLAKRLGGPPIVE
jgi:hypothetical protein